LGDSVTAGLGARKGYSYFDRLLENPVDEFEDMKGVHLGRVFPSLRATNLAVSGTTSREHLERQMPRLPESPSNELVVVVFTTGGNDLIHNYGRVPPRADGMYGATYEQAVSWIGAFEERLEEMIGRIRTAYPDRCQIFLANIYDPTDGVGDIEKSGMPPWPDGLRIHADYNRILAACAGRHANVHLIDLHAAFLGHGLHCTQIWREHYRSEDPHYWYYINLEDPNERGYDAIRRLFLNAMAKVFEAPVLILRSAAL
jgi:lysophospholipase L1-like esterase